MSHPQRWVPLLLAAWLGLGALATLTPRASSSAGAAAPVSHCDHSPAAGEPVPAPKPPAPASPCHWPLPLVCCQQVAAASSAGHEVAPAVVIWLASPPRLASITERPALRAGIDERIGVAPPRKRSVVLQV